MEDVEGNTEDKGPKAVEALAQGPQKICGRG